MNVAVHTELHAPRPKLSGSVSTYPPRSPSWFTTTTRKLLSGGGGGGGGGGAAVVVGCGCSTVVVSCSTVVGTWTSVVVVGGSNGMVVVVGSIVGAGVVSKVVVVVVGGGSTGTLDVCGSAGVVSTAVLDGSAETVVVVVSSCSVVRVVDCSSVVTGRGLVVTITRTVVLTTGAGRKVVFLGTTTGGSTGTVGCGSSSVGCGSSGGASVGCGSGSPAGTVGSAPPAGSLGAASVSVGPREGSACVVCSTINVLVGSGDTSGGADVAGRSTREEVAAGVGSATPTLLVGVLKRLGSAVLLRVLLFTVLLFPGFLVVPSLVDADPTEDAPAGDVGVVSPAPPENSPSEPANPLLLLLSGRFINIAGATSCLNIIWSGLLTGLP